MQLPIRACLTCATPVILEKLKKDKRKANWPDQKLLWHEICSLTQLQPQTLRAVTELEWNDPNYDILGQGSHKHLIGEHLHHATAENPSRQATVIFVAKPTFGSAERVAYIKTSDTKQIESWTITKAQEACDAFTPYNDPALELKRKRSFILQPDPELNPKAHLTPGTQITKEQRPLKPMEADAPSRPSTPHQQKQYDKTSPRIPKCALTPEIPCMYHDGSPPTGTYIIPIDTYTALLTSKDPKDVALRLPTIPQNTTKISLIVTDLISMRGDHYSLATLHLPQATNGRGPTPAPKRAQLHIWNCATAASSAPESPHNPINIKRHLLSLLQHTTCKQVCSEVDILVMNTDQQQQRRDCGVHTAIAFLSELLNRPPQLTDPQASDTRTAKIRADLARYYSSTRNIYASSHHPHPTTIFEWFPVKGGTHSQRVDQTHLNTLGRNENIPAPLLAAIILETAATNGHGQLARIIGSGTIHPEVFENRVQTQNLETGIALLRRWSEIGHALKPDLRKIYDTQTNKIAELQELATVMEQTHDGDQNRST